MAETIEDLMTKTSNVSLATGDEISHADLTNVIPEVWGSQIEADADKFRVFRNFCIVNTDLLNKPGDTVKLPKRAILDYDLYGPHDIASDLEELTPDAELSVDIVEIKPTEVGMAGAITKQIIEEAMISVMESLLLEFSRSYAQREDIDIIKALVATTTGEEITYVEANADSDDYVSGAWTAAKAGTLSAVDVGKRQNQLKWSATQTNITSADVIDVGVVVEAKQVIMNEAGFMGDVIVLHPKQTADFLRNPQFSDASKLGTNSVLMTGQICNFMGLRVYESQNLPMLACGADGNTKGYQALLIDTARAVGYAIKRTMIIESEYKPGLRKHFLYMTWVAKAKRLNDGAVVAINTA